MAMATGMLRSASASPIERRSRGGRRCAGEVRCTASMSGSLAKQYRTLRIQPGASENEVKKAFRQLALQYHPDVCKESNCSVQFQQIYEAYDILMTKFIQGEEDQTPKTKKPNKRDYDGLDEPFRESMIQVGSCGKNGWAGKEQELGTTLPTLILTFRFSPQIDLQ